MITTDSVSVLFGGEYLFKNVSFLISEGERIGLIGSNGAGKSTLMKILLNFQQPDEGRVQKSRMATIGYLPQEGVVLSNSPLREEAMKAFADIVQLEDEIHIIASKITELSTDENAYEEIDTLVHELGELQHRFEAMSGFAKEGQVEKVLMGLGFTIEDMTRPCGEFSGGWQMRIELAKLLLQNPTLLMLDEPTNHLDIESLAWLEDFLSTYKGAILLISHDKKFLDNLTNRTFELSRKRLTTYTGNYTKYLELREANRVQQQSAYENQQKQIAETQDFIDRFRYKATKAVQVQSRIKQLDKIDVLEPPEPEESGVHFQFPRAPRSGRVLAETVNLSKSYDKKLILQNINFAIERGEKIAFLGRNGEGKTTLSKIIADLESYDGELKIGHNVLIGYFAQHQAEELNPKQTVLETLDSVATGDMRTQLRSLLGAFLFNGDDVFKPVSVLSGGEKSRLSLAKLLLEPVNLLIMDEPTNHLDMRSIAVLKKAVAAFEGAVIVVSHDRDFLSGIMTRCIEFKDKKIKEYIGGIEEFLYKKNAQSVEETIAFKKDNSSKNISQNQESEKDRKRREAEERNKKYSLTKDVRKKLDSAVIEIDKLEKEKLSLEEQLNLPQILSDSVKLKKLRWQLEITTKQLEKNFTVWEKLTSELESVESQFTT
ncbi:MAG: ABC-F family ATP-binding cassette domain-containing protein [Chlorobiota bacterium]|nr:ABC-F family ATP-binding cassette domain-containing protein [Chlorobiota bacterium]QQS67284.1 MAG: ABC-F family ATP-binding cassette domain-containing protein [Chlorobiota bacterium]